MSASTSTTSVPATRTLAYLGRLPLPTLKLAGSLVEGLGRAKATPDEPIVASLVALAHTLGLTVTAEGVKRTAQVTRLRELGCDTAQGWLLARPAPWEEVARLLDAPLALRPTEGGDRGRAAS